MKKNKVRTLSGNQTEPGMIILRKISQTFKNVLDHGILFWCIKRDGGRKDWHGWEPKKTGVGVDECSLSAECI